MLNADTQQSSFAISAHRIRNLLGIVLSNQHDAQNGFNPAPQGAQQRSITMKRTIDGTKIVFTFDGGLAPITFDTSAPAAHIQERARMHGWSQKLGDTAAIPRKDPKTGVVITVTEEMRHEAISAAVRHFESGGDWAAARAAPESPAIRALATALDVTYAEAEAHVAKIAAGGL